LDRVVKAGRSSAGVPLNAQTREAIRIEKVELNAKINGINKIIERQKSLDDLFLELRDTNNIFETATKYIQAANKEIYVGTAENAIRNIMRNNPEAFPKNTKAMIESQLEYTRGKQSFGDRILDEFLCRTSCMLENKTGIKTRVPNNVWSTISSRARIANTNLKLGYRPVAAFINKLGGEAHTWTKFGSKHMHRGKEFLKTQEGKDWILAQEKLGRLGIDVLLDEAGRVNSKGNALSPMKLFSVVEPGIRKTAIATAYKYALDELKMSKGAAELYAARSLRLTNLSYNLSALPQFLRGPSGKLFGQFKRYLTGEIEFMSTLSRKEWARYVTGQMLIAGPRGALTFVKSLPILGALGFWDNIQSAFTKAFSGVDDEGRPSQSVASGVPGLFNADISSPATLQLSSRPEDLLGSVVGDGIRLFRDVIGPLLSGLRPGFGAFAMRGAKDDFIDWGSESFVALRYWGELMDSVIDSEGWVLDRNGNKLYQINDGWDQFMLANGVQTVGRANIQTYLNQHRQEQKVALRNRQRIVGKITQRLLGKDQQLRRLGSGILLKMSKGETIPLDYLQDVSAYLAATEGLDDNLTADLQALGVNPETIKRSLKMSQLSPRIRETLRVRLLDKAKVMDLLR
jgi:hypothetical protein